MKVTYILKDFTSAFYDGIPGHTVGLLNMPDREKFEYLNKKANEYMGSGVTQKIGNGSFRDKVDLNQILRGVCAVEFKLEPRKGYKLVTFEIT